MRGLRVTGLIAARSQGFSFTAPQAYEGPDSYGDFISKTDCPILAWISEWPCRPSTVAVATPHLPAAPPTTSPKRRKLPITRTIRRRADA